MFKPNHPDHTYTNWHRRRIIRRIERKFGTRNKCAHYLADTGHYSNIGSARAALYGLTSLRCECAWFNVSLYRHLLTIC